MADDFDRYVVVMHTRADANEMAKRMAKISAELGSLVAPVYGKDGTYIIGCVTDMTAHEIFNLVAFPGCFPAVFSIGRDFAIPEPLGEKFTELMGQHPAWKARDPGW